VLTCTRADLTWIAIRLLSFQLAAVN